jgi:hypothetical protein
VRETGQWVSSYEPEWCRIEELGDGSWNLGFEDLKAQPVELEPGEGPKRLDKVRERRTPPGLDEDFVPPGKGGTPPGHERRGFTPPEQGELGQEKRSSEPKQNGSPPGQAGNPGARGQDRGKGKP